MLTGYRDSRKGCLASQEGPRTQPRTNYFANHDTRVSNQCYRVGEYQPRDAVGNGEGWPGHEGYPRQAHRGQGGPDNVRFEVCKPVRRTYADYTNREDLREQNALSEEIVNAITTGQTDNIIDEDLEDELDQMQQEALDEQMVGTGTVPVSDRVHQMPAAANGPSEEIPPYETMTRVIC